MDENIDDLKKRIEEQAKQIARLRYERDVAREQTRKLLPKATPEQEEELRRELQGPMYDLGEIIAEFRRDAEGDRGA